MQKSPRRELILSILWRYGLCIILVALAVIFTLLLQKAFSTPFWRSFFFVWVVIGSTWFLGKGPGFMAVVLSTLAVDYYFTPPFGQFSHDPGNLPFVVVFFIFAFVSGFVSSRLKDRETALGKARDELEERVRERTKELEKSNILLLSEIEERKHAEKILHKQAGLLQLTHDSIFVRDGNGLITYWNRGAEELYGWKSGEAIGKVTHELLQTVFPEPLEDIMAQLVRSGHWEGELVHTRRDGMKVVVSSRWAVQKDELGQPASVLETNNDITERKRAEEGIRKLNEELEARVMKRTEELGEVNRELEAFAYSVSHDLRAPLRHLAGYAELLQKSASSDLDEKSARYVATILESAKRMGELIDDLLSFSRTSRVEIKKARVSLDGLVNEVVNELRRETGGRDVVWRIGALPDVYGDRSMLRLVFVNLISNAIKFTRRRQQAVIEVGCADGETKETAIFVRDNGVGFDMKYVNKLFGVFQRLHRTEEFEGTGIGLAHVQRIIYRHGGRVWAEGAPDKGAAFYLTLPRPPEDTGHE